MISAGYYDNGMQGPNGPYNGYGQQNPWPYPQQQGPQVGNFTPISVSSGPVSTPVMNISAEITDEKWVKEQVGNQNMWAGIGMISNSVNQSLAAGLNYALAAKSLESQANVAEKYYQTQDNIASYQRDVSLHQLAVQETAIYAQQDMHRDQMLHEEKMARLEGSVAARLASIQEDGKTKRAEIMTMNDAFSRRGWDMGIPTIAA